MCGIAGQIGGQTNRQTRARLERALLLMQARGPDAQGEYLADQLALGHRRLSILDLDERASQPMFSDDGRYAIVFNGEIYNFRQLRESLEQKQYVFRTNSDTEVLLYGFIDGQMDFIEKCIGMFAFAFVDLLSNELYLVRDRLGIKPCYYHFDNGVLSFASQINALLELSGVEKKLDKHAVSSYLSFRYPIADRTFFEGVRSLTPGHYLHFKNNQIKIEPYWDCLPAFKHTMPADEEPELVLRNLLRSAVEYRMVSDVPVGAYLSGGVDSSALVAMMASMAEKKVKTYSIGFEAEGYNEFEYSRMVARDFDTDHTEITMEEGDYFDAMSELIRLKGAPLSVPNEIPIWQLSKILKKDITVVLSGEGADECFMGYGRIFRSANDYRRFNAENVSAVFKENFVKEYGQAFDNELDHFLSQYDYFGFEDKNSLLADDFPLQEAEKETRNFYSRYFAALPESDYESRISYVFLKVHLPGLLQRLDNATMAASVEGRVPFVDHRMVEFAASLPTDTKLAWAEGVNEKTVENMQASQISENYDVPKAVLKKALEGILDHRVLYRKKVGFPVPLHRWFKGDFEKIARRILLSESAARRGIYDQQEIARRLDSGDVDKSHRLAMKIWMLLNLEVFLQQYFDTD